MLKALAAISRNWSLITARRRASGPGERATPEGRRVANDDSEWRSSATNRDSSADEQPDGPRLPRDAAAGTEHNAPEPREQRVLNG